MVSGISIPSTNLCVRDRYSKSPGTNTSSKPGAGGVDLMPSKKARTPFWYSSTGVKALTSTALHENAVHGALFDIKRSCQSTE